MKYNTLSVVIVTYNCWHYLEICIQSIIESNYSVKEIIVVDNGSVDGTSEKLHTTFEDVILIQNPKNMGFIRAVNQGFKAVTGEYVLLLDSDTELKDHAIKLMCEFMDAHTNTSMVVPRTLNPDGTTQETARKFPSMINGLFGRQSILTKLFPDNPFSKRYLIRTDLDNQKPFKVEMVSAACVMFRKNILATVGMLDEGYSRFVGYWSDADWCKRIQKSSGVVYCLPKAIIVHHEQNKPFRKKNPMRIIEFHTGAYRFFRLHYTYGIWDPRSLISAFLLSIRALLLLSANTLKKAPEALDPMSHQKKAGSYSNLSNNKRN